MKNPIALISMRFVGLVFGLCFGGCREKVTQISLAPDDSLRVHVVETNAFIDRNFEVRLERLPEGSIEVLFDSPDEGRPIGSERIIWSPDSRQFLLVGRHLFVREGTPTLGGESLYLLCDVKSGKMWCNAQEQYTHPTFDTRDVEWALPARDGAGEAAATK